jgi:hypothetical protein
MKVLEFRFFDIKMKLSQRGTETSGKSVRNGTDNVQENVKTGSFKDAILQGGAILWVSTNLLFGKFY